MPNLVVIMSINRIIVTQDRSFAVSSQIWCVGKHRGARDIGGKIETCRCIAAGKAAAHGPLSSAVFIMHLSSDVLLSLGAGKALP